MPPPTEPVDGVLAELREFLLRSILAHNVATAGVRQIASLFAASPRTPENPDPRVHLGASGDPNLTNVTMAGSVKMSEAMVQIAPDGPVFNLLGQQWLVFTFTAWEHEFRPRLARANGVDKEVLTYPLLGDLRHIRNDILHCQGIATAEHSGRCEVLGDWVRVGDEITIRGSHVAEFMERFPWDEMAAGPDRQSTSG
jgi:hypothetical protein